jgi:hypothetical protein
MLKSAGFLNGVRRIRFRVERDHYQGDWAQCQIRMGLEIRCYTGFNKDGSKNKGEQRNSSESVDHQNQRHIRE